MKVIVAGSREIRDRETVGKAMDAAPFEINTLIHGGAKGVDTIAAKLTEIKRFENIEVEEYEADWASYGDAAGPKRNREMAKEADALIAVWDGESSGTRSMIREAIKHNLDIYIKNTSEKDLPSKQTQITETVQ